MSDCQLQSLEESVVELSMWQKRVRTIRRRGFYLRRRLQALFSRSSQPEFACMAASAKMEKTDPSSIMSPLNLQPGETVRVKSFAEIMQTLDSNSKFQGLSYTPAMKKYCGGTFTVYKRVNLVFDERRWKLSKIKNVVLLNGVYCDGDGGAGKDWDGCDRSCFIWWKEGWLERISR